MLFFTTMLFLTHPVSGVGGQVVEQYASHSVLSSGTWYKIGLPETGIYKLTYSDLSSLGVNMSGLNPRNIRIYHNGGGVLPELNAASRHDDLVEIPIFVSGESDGKFDQGDYILFFGGGPVSWSYKASNALFEHNQNPYDDYAYAFLTVSLGAGKRIGENDEITEAAEIVVTDFLDYQVHESDEINLNRMGRSYYGDLLNGNIGKDFSFSFPNVVNAKPVVIKTAMAGRNYKSASLDVYLDGLFKATYRPMTTTSNGDMFADEVGGVVSGYPTSDVIKVSVQHVASDNSVSIGYIDYIIVNAWRRISLYRGQLQFRNPEAAVTNSVYEYRIANANSNMQVWDVSNPTAPFKIKGHLASSVYSFKTYGRQDNQFVAFDGTSFLSATMIGQVMNQDLHGVRNVDFVIVSYPDFLTQAERLKSIHEVNDPDLNLFITTPERIYNEFSCGAQDISAIRDFCRMLYLDSNSNRLRYLLLFGDASFDYKNRNEIVNFVPTFETVASLDSRAAVVTDDFFGCFDENEGALGSSLSDIGIGRFPVSTLEQATQMVDKVERYIQKNSSTMQPWRNVVTLLTDDEKSFMDQAESFERVLLQNGGENVIVDKIYLDAYPQVSTPNGQIAPEVNAAINRRMEKGTLVVNYSGHGGEVQLSTERILQRKDVDSWRNAPMYPLMITGTCEFSRFDDHVRTSLGEYAFLNPYGGMVAMFTTSRVTQGPNNSDFNQGVYRHLFQEDNGERMRLGDVYRLAKTSGSLSEKRYVFFGDPALRISYPKWKVETLKINGNEMGTGFDSIPVLDTIGALQPVELEGVVKKPSGEIATDFNGIVYVSVYDKESHLTTLGDEGAPYAFNLRNSIVFNGTTNVVEGHFKISFIVPRDISYSYGRGLISYYATNYEVDANGKTEDFIIGGFYDDIIADYEGPDIRLFIDDTLFVNGGITGENPMLLAFVEDESGINTTGAGIGHDITATISGEVEQTYYLNDYFVADVGHQGKGVISYKMLDLPNGTYTLFLRVWDIYNNSNTVSVDFTVVNSSGVVIENATAAPNPMRDETSFSFEHNQIGNSVDVQIQVFDILGRLVTTLEDRMEGTSARTNPIRWDGRAQNGQSLSNGVYLYRIVVTNDKGETGITTSKLVICR